MKFQYGGQCRQNRMVKWFCSSGFCFNNFRSRNSNGENIKFYRLPRDPKIQRNYTKILQTSGINWRAGHICAEHWSNGCRKDAKDLPDIAVPTSQLPLMENKLRKAKLRIQKKAKPKKLDKTRIKYLERKLLLAKRHVLNKASLSDNRKRKAAPEKNNDSQPKAKKIKFSKRQLAARVEKLEKENKLLKEEKVITQNSDNQLQSDMSTLQELLKKSQKNEEKLQSMNEALKLTITRLHEKRFSYANLVKRAKTLKYMCGLSIDQFNVLWHCVEPYCHLINYPDCVNNQERTLDKTTELISVLTVCRHALHQGVMAFILEISKSTIHRIFVGWIVFLEALFSRLDLKPEKGFLLQKMPEIFVKTGHGLTDLVIDCTEFKFQHVTNLDLNSLMFSNYKNTITGKALIGIAPHGMGLYFSDIYPGSISDNSITEQTDVIALVQPEHELMADKGFALQDLCAEKGIYFNRPPQKMEDQFSQAEVAANFDIAATRIHVERFIGRVREWSILNAVWPVQQMDLLSSTWQVLCHIVNLTMAPVGPKDKTLSK